MRRFSITAILVLTTLLAFAQRGNYNIYNLSSENGLPTSDFQFVYQDSYGFLWLASYDGLFRWDGYAFKKYYHNEKDPNSLNHNIVYSVFEDSQRHLWIGTIEGLNLYDRAIDGFIKCTIGQQGQKIPVNAILEDSKHRLWLGTSFGLCTYDHTRGTSEWHNNQSSDDIIFALAVDASDNIWAGTFNDGLRMFSPETKTFTSFRHTKNDARTIASDKIKSLLIDHENKIWVGTADNGVSVVNTHGKVLKHYPHFTKDQSAIQGTINCIYEDKRKTIWIGVGRESLFYMDGDHPEPLTETLNDNNQNQFLSVSSICEDSFGNIWFATNGNGLFYTNATKNVFENYLRTTGNVKGLESNTVTCFYEDTNQNIWIGTDGGGLLKFDPRNKSFARFTAATHKFSSNAISDIKGDAHGNLWLTTWHGGVIQFDPQTNRVANFVNDPANENSLIYNDAKTLLVDDTILWIGTHGKGLTAYDFKRRAFIHHKNNTVFPFNLNLPAWINHLYKDSKQRLWISTYGGLFVFDGKRLDHYTHSTDTLTISSNSVNMVTEDNTGRIWVISESGGLDRYDERANNFVRLSEKFHLPETMKAIVADERNTLWITSNEGIISFNEDTHTLKRYDASEGLQGNTFFHKAALRAKNGKLYLGGPRGFNAFHPDSLKALPIPSHFYLTDLYIYNQKQTPNSSTSPLKKVLSLTDQLTLTHEQSFFSIEFAAVNFYSPTKTQYAYILEGLHDQWIDLQKERKVSFTNLDPGTYTLRVRYTDIAGAWDKAENKFSIVILPPWWKTLWFKFAVVILAITVISGVFYIRVNAIKKRNEFLKDEVQRRTHELSEANEFLIERNEEINLQKERLEEFNEEILRQSDKILDQQMHISGQNQKLEHHVDELQKLNKTKDHFFSILAHDLKNPISALTGISDFVKNNFTKLEKKDAQEYLNSIYKSSNAIYDLLINLLNWSQTQSKSIEYSPVTVSVKELVQENATLLEQQFTNKHITLQINVNPEHFIFADYNMTNTVIRNILSNSVKFTEYNGTVTITSHEHDDEIILSLSDTGVGMTRDQLQALFKLDKSNISVGTAGERGTGLGLIVSKEFIEINKGRIEVQSEAGKGTTFLITLPKAVAATKGKTKLTKMTVANDSLALGFWEAFPMEKLTKIKGKKILIVDDNRELRTYLKLLISETFEIFEAENGKEGLALALEVQPTAIISDIIMPQMNGIEFCKEIKGNTSTSHIPVILLTSQSEERSQLSGYEAGADAYLTKPVKKEILIQVILNLIQNQEKVRERMRDNILGDNTTHSENIVVNKRDEEFLNRLIEFINQNLSDTTLDARILGEEFGISRSILYTKIKTLTGQSVHEFIKSIRLKQSLKLLLEGRLTISQVALEVGFNSHSYFDKCFIKQFGMGPKEYVNKRKGSKV
ncbi:hybrid sensor histidine kinase/response regulator transcription factor [Chryseolinea lacunae]|uniref:histidine kinase n=1 Tax=Chryseolinea lacunae TaxID=2801331 RepID=A0ABS1KYT4_9BACT|nr:hybrid sensor histidine kinase/response regulator transcription factor [Chryseolinea lacunae]MBL0744422.1 response regulator [Chryseolinea lacunae]